MEPKDWDGAPLDAVEAQARPKRPLWKRITAGLSLLGAVGLAISSLGNSSLSELVTAEGLGAGAPGCSDGTPECWRCWCCSQP